jgi:hypothetical protein
MGTPPGQTGGVYHFWGTELAIAKAGAPDPAYFFPDLLFAVLLLAAGFLAAVVFLAVVVFFAPVLFAAVAFFAVLDFVAVVFLAPVLFAAVVFFAPALFDADVFRAPLLLAAVVFFAPPVLFAVVFLAPLLLFAAGFFAMLSSSLRVDFGLEPNRLQSGSEILRCSPLVLLEQSIYTEAFAGRGSTVARMKATSAWRRLTKGLR